MAQVSQEHGQSELFQKHYPKFASSWGKTTNGSLVLFCLFISDLEGNMESMLIILTDVTKLKKVVC